MLPFQVPALRERPEDIALLSDYFLRKFCSSFSKELKGFSSEATDFLIKRPWRGNVREFENLVQRAVLLCKEDLIGVQDFMLDDQASPEMVPSGIKEMEKDLILKTLRETNGNKAKAAKLLGVTARTIRNKLEEYGKDFPAVGKN